MSLTVGSLKSLRTGLTEGSEGAYKKRKNTGLCSTEIINIFVSIPLG